MKIAVTADCHLDSGARHSKRVEALDYVMQRSVDVGAEAVIIAGDLFDDRGSGDYSQFEGLCRKHRQMPVHVIPGNHDANLNSRSISIGNVHVHDEPVAVEVGGFPFLFVPYADGVRMAEPAATADRPRGRWALVGHGDYTTALRVRNEYEQGTYMPISAAEVRELGASLVFLGHIHKPCSFDAPVLHYPGSPCGMDINETGRRSFILFDTESLSVSREPVDTGTVFLQAAYTLIPERDSLRRLRSRALATVEEWKAEVPELSARALIRVRASGFTDDRVGVRRVLEEAFADLRFYDEDGPDLSGLRESGDRQRSALAEAAEAVIDELDWEFEGREPSREEVLRHALALIWNAEAD